MNRIEFEDWYKQGLNDFKSAKKMLKEGIYDAATFYCEQSIQKLLKAAWIKLKKEFPPRVHNIYKLGKSLKAPEEILELLRRITPYYYISRYPDAANGVPYELIGKKIAEEIIEASERVVDWIKGIV
ncbi:MAG: HEPN domain-containing protein [Candidatus Helarchaeota archaeon]